MDQVIVVAYPEPLPIEARPLEHAAVPDGSIGLGYYFRGRMIARGVVTTDAVDAIHSLLTNPIPIALAATEDDDGNIDARVCLVVPVDSEQLRDGEEEEADEPWKESVPKPPPEIESSYSAGAESERPQVALFPIGNVVRNARDRKHPDVADDAREMLENLLAGKAKDPVSKAIDDLLDSI